MMIKKKEGEMESQKCEGCGELADLYSVAQRDDGTHYERMDGSFGESDSQLCVDCAGDLLDEEKAHRRKAAAQMGRAKSPAKTAAAQENAKKGGRPRVKTATRFHRDGSVTYWSVCEERWKGREIYVPDEELAAMPGKERDRVRKHLAQAEAVRKLDEEA